MRTSGSLPSTTRVHRKSSQKGRQNQTSRDWKLRIKSKPQSHNNTEKDGDRINCNRIKWRAVTTCSRGISANFFFIILMKHNQVVWRETNRQEDGWQKENVTNRTEIKVTEECAARARSHVRGLWPVSHIIEQSVRHSSSAVPVALSPVKNYQKESCVLSSFVPFLLLSFSSSSSVPLFVCSVLPLRSVLGHRLPLFLHHDALYICGSQLF